MNESYPITQIGKDRLEEELTHLVRVEREKIIESLKEARALGDLRENAEYHAAKEKQSLVEGRIGVLQNKLARVQVVDVSSLEGPTIKFGATVTLFDLQKDKELIYQIVGIDEADLKNNKLPINSPLAKSLLGKQVGDTVKVDAPKGKLKFEIEKVEYI